MVGQDWTQTTCGTAVTFSAERRDDGAGLYKAFLIGPAGCELPLGTLMPEKGSLKLQRTLQKTELERKGVWPVTSIDTRLAYAFTGVKIPAGWVRAKNLAALMPESFLAHSAAGICGALVREMGGRTLLAIPWERGKEFPFTALFCLARVETIAAQLWVIFTLPRRAD